MSPQFNEFLREPVSNFNKFMFRFVPEVYLLVQFVPLPYLNCAFYLLPVEFVPLPYMNCIFWYRSYHYRTLIVPLGTCTVRTITVHEVYRLVQFILWYSWYHHTFIVPKLCQVLGTWYLVPNTKCQVQSTKY